MSSRILVRKRARCELSRVRLQLAMLKSQRLILTTGGTKNQLKPELRTAVDGGLLGSKFRLRKKIAGFCL